MIEEEFKRRVKQALYSYDLLQIQDKYTQRNDKPTLPILHNQLVEANVTLVEKTVAYLKNNLDKNINLPDLALTMATNRTSLSTAFKAYFDMTVMNWFFEQRMLHAAQLLEIASLSILEIADKVGYPHSSYFAVAFKRRFNMPPKNYRNKYRQEL